MIKKFIFLLFIVVVIFTFLSCTTLKEEPTASNDSTLSKLNDYIEQIETQKNINTVLDLESNDLKESISLLQYDIIQLKKNNKHLRDSNEELMETVENLTYNYLDDYYLKENLYGITLGSTYNDIISSCGTPIEEKSFSSEGGLSSTLSYDGFIFHLVNNKVIAIDISKANTEILKGIKITDSVNNIYSTFSKIDFFYYPDDNTYRFFRKCNGGFKINIYVTTGIIESISINNMYP